MSKTTPSLILLLTLLVPAAASAKRPKRSAPADDQTSATSAQPAPASTASTDEPPAVAPAPPPPVAIEASEPVPPEVIRKRLGVGYKIGNGLGFVGADVVINLVDHLTLDVQGHWLSIGVGESRPATGWGIGAEAQLFLKKGQVSSPYLGLGVAHARLSLDDVSASATGFFANLGYEFRWQSGIGILLGAGAGYLGDARAASATTRIETNGGAYFNLEAGLRYMFL